MKRKSATHRTRSENLRARCRYWFRKLIRHPGDPAYLARGVALGLLIGFLIPIGAQLIVVIPLAFLLRAAKVPAIAATWISNPFTVFLIYPAQFYLGSYLIFHPLSFAGISGNVRQLLLERSPEAFWALGGQLIASFFAGGVLFGGIAAGIGYCCTLRAVRAYRQRRAERRQSA